MAFISFKEQKEGKYSRSVLLHIGNVEVLDKEKNLYLRKGYKDKGEEDFAFEFRILKKKELKTLLEDKGDN